MKKKILVISMLLCMLLTTGCSKEEPKKMEVKENPIVTMEFDKYGEIQIELYPNKAYNTVANFVNLVEDGFYDYNNITRVQKGFVLQAGGTKETDYTIKGEFEANGIENNIKHEEGIVSMARTNEMDSASGQFFIMLDAADFLDGQYAAFGKVIKGMDVVHKIENDESLKFDKNMESLSFLDKKSYIRITKAIVDTKGHTYKVEKIK